MAKEILGYTPRWSFHQGVTKFLTWASGQEASGDGYGASLREMKERGLYHE
jgi:dTDP-L-rhamnose 4-epimerase